MVSTRNTIYIVESIDEPKQIRKGYLHFNIYCKLRRLYSWLFLTLCYFITLFVVYYLYVFIVRYAVHNSIIESRPITVYDYKLHRFIGENISLHCESDFNPENVSYTWFLNGSEIKADSRHRFYTSNISHQWLWVLHLDEKDFGEYSCEMQHKNDRSRVHSFFVHRIDEIHKQVVVPIGESLIVYILINNLQGNDHFFYTVDGGPAFNTVTRFRCSWFNLLCLNVNHRFINVKKKVYNHSFTVKYTICPSPDKYGYYRFYIQSQILNPELNEQEAVVVQLPLVYNVMVDKSIRYDNPLFNISTINSGPLEPNESTEGHIKAETIVYFIVDSLLYFCTLCSCIYCVMYLQLHVYGVIRITRTVCPNMQFHVKDNQTLLNPVILGLSVIVLLKMVWSVDTIGYYLDVIQNILILTFCVYSSDVIIIFNVTILTKDHSNTTSFFKNRIVYRTPSMCEWKQTYDIYLSYSDHDKTFVEKKILPLLERRGFRVFFRTRDVLPGQSGLNAICESEAFLVMAARNTVRDVSRATIEWSMIRYQLSVSNKRSSANVLMVFSRELSEDFRIIKWLNNL